ncbi:hypothetical protein [Pseudoroseomonas cervicalis]|uniref:hypothetical protein n=1 Tax=Teichococcus cervicalis TaxID=204525 RepID=UPI0022F1A566|nr:hypothetical protein [Pseudoroseomonas cervicalis]WBV44728.1 hypothetical protein PFY06_18335 [Pseudoroseomonas cervicalis]
MTIDEAAGPAVPPPASPPPPRAAPSAGPLMLGLLLLLLLTGPFGWLAAFGAGVALWTLLPQALAVLGMGTLYLLAGEGPPGRRAWGAMAWGGGGACGAAVPVALALLVFPWLEERFMLRLPGLLTLVDLAWLALVAAAPLWLPGRERWAGPLLALVTGTSWLVAMPMTLLLGLSDGPLLALPVFLLGLAGGVFLVLSLGLVLAAPPWSLRHRWPLPRSLAVLALLLLALRLLVVAAGWQPFGS